MSSPDPSLGIKCIATIFGLNYDGSRDQGDDGIGAFENPQTGRFYRTANESIVGVSIPIPFYEETPGMSRSDIENGLVTATIQDSSGRFYTGLKIVDLGPGEHGLLIKDSSGAPHLLDRTYALCALMASMDDAPITYWLMKDGSPYLIKGQNTSYITI
jgi:hypothetical protein